MTSKLRRLKKFCFNRYPAVSGKGWWHHILIFETSIFTKLFQQSPLARQLCKILPILKNIFMFGFCVFVFGKEVTGQCGNIVKTPPPTVNLSRREKREREGERDTKRTVNVILLTKLPDAQFRRLRSDQFKPSKEHW